MMMVHKIMIGDGIFFISDGVEIFISEFPSRFYDFMAGRNFRCPTLYNQDEEFTVALF